MNFLPYFVYWLINRDLSNDLDLCTNKYSGDNGICLSEWSCTEITKGVIVGSCNSRAPEDVCCKIIVHSNIGKLDISHLILANRARSNLTKTWEMVGEALTKHRLNYENTHNKDNLGVVEDVVEEKSEEIDNIGNSDPTRAKIISKIGKQIRKTEGYPMSGEHPALDIPLLLIPDTTHYAQKSVLFDQTHDMNKLIQPFPIHDHREPVQLHPLHDIRRPVQVNPTHDIRRPVQVNPTHDLRIPVQVDPTHDLRRPIQVDPTHDLRKPVQIDPTHDLRNPVRINPSHDLRRPVELGLINDLQSQVQVDSTHDLRKPVQIDPMHDLRRPVQVEPTHDLRRPVQVEPTHDLRKPVQVDSTHDLRRPVQVDFTHDLRRPVERDLVYDIQKPVQIGPTFGLRLPIQLESTYDLQNPVQFDPRHDLQKAVEPDSEHNQWSPVKLEEIIDLRWPAVEELYHGLRNLFPELNTMRNENQKPDFRKLSRRDTTHKLQTFEPVHDRLKSTYPQKTHNLWRFIFDDATQDLQKCSQRDPTNEKRTSVLPDTKDVSGKCSFQERTLAIWKKFQFLQQLMLNISHYPMKPDQVEPARDFREAIQVDLTNNPQKPVQPYPTQDLKQPVYIDPMRVVRNTVQVNPTHDMRKPVQVDPTHDMRKPVQVDPTHDMRKPVQVDPTHDMRKPVQVDPTHDMSKPVQVHPTHDMRKPVQVDPTHDMRKPVLVDPTHNLRKPVKLMETHDLRWPVVEERDHGIRNPMLEMDIFRSNDVDKKLKEIIQEYLKKGSKNGFVANEHDPVYQLLHEDEFLMLQCTPDYLTGNGSASSIKTNSEHTMTAMKSEYKKIFNESLKACGIPFIKSTEQSFKKGSSMKWPWMVSLQEYMFSQFWHKCAGTLLNNLWVITAAHCVESRPKWDFMIQLGVDDSAESRSYIKRFVDRISIHPQFKNMDLNHDIALLRMESPVGFQSDIIPICLPWKSEVIENKKAFALGWRLETERRVTLGSLQEKAAPVLTNEECEVMFSETGTTKSFLCPRFQDGRQDSCIGDSGGPLVVSDDNGKWSMEGLYSWGTKCSSTSRPEVYLRISRYADWIEYTIACYENNINLHEMN